jgi:2-iminobutanoate/2-iminopropanoate deaminase
MTQRSPVTTPNAPKAIGPYSQAVVAQGLLFVSGQIPLDPKTGELVEGDVTVQTERVLQNVGAVLEAGGASFASVVKTTIYVTDIAEFAMVNSVYSSFFREAPPARATVQVAALPKGARVEIDAIALVD